MKTRIVAAGLAAVTITAVGTTTASARPATDTSDKTVPQACTDALGQRQGTFVWEGPTASWPPNHKEIAAQITLYDEDAEALTDDVTIEVVGIHDEATYDDNGLATGEQNGTGNTDPATDSRGGVGGGTESASVPVAWRSERSGRGDGRTYTFTVEGTTDTGLSTCAPVTYTATVPHDQGNGAGKPGAKKKKRLSLRRAR